MDAYTTIVGFFQSGGFFMYPIVLILALGLAIAIERYIYLSMARTSNHRVWKKLQPLLQKGDYLQVAMITEKSRSAISHIFSYGLNRARTSRRRDDVEIAMEEGLMETVPNHAVSQYLGRHEYHGIRSDGRHPAVADLRRTANQDHPTG